MSTNSLTFAARRTGLWVRVADYLELTKPRIAVLVLITVGVAGYLASWGQPVTIWAIVHAMIGTALVASSASAMNQLLERRSDQFMQRTESRPLPAGRLTVAEVATFGGVTLAVGVVYLLLTLNLLTASLGLLTWVMYVGIYTPLKSRTSFNTTVGAVAGAMPVLIGWAAVGNGLDLRAATIFGIVFLWQFPHFMAIAWIYRKQYAAAGLKMLPVVDPTGRRAGVQAVGAALALLPLCLLPAVLPVMPNSILYLLPAFALTTAQLAFAVMFCARLDLASARGLLRASLVYLPAMMGLLMLLPLL